ncbi:hypothetical protein HAX54_004416 [Datura stramonium]|uniref:Uncharacterized protein n=1 Tax=Datura stramonium TaxID=4076 RepID=A0ABS8T6W8_DATST|nr:hypothetical protein [Datura stramonium]
MKNLFSFKLFHFILKFGNVRPPIDAETQILPLLSVAIPETKCDSAVLVDYSSHVIKALLHMALQFAHQQIKIFLSE